MLAFNSVTQISFIAYSSVLNGFNHVIFLHTIRCTCNVVVTNNTDVLETESSKQLKLFFLMKENLDF